LVLTAHLPGPWGEALKSVLAVKGLEYVAVAQEAGGDNAELKAWTGQSSAPVLVWNDNAPRVSWLDQLMLAETLAPQPALLGADPGERAMIVGLCREIAGEGGLGWNRRTQLLGAAMSGGNAPRSLQVMADRYGFTPDAFDACEGELVAILDWFAGRLSRQADAGSDYLVGAELSAADLYLANFLGMLDPLPPALNPMPDGLRQTYSYRTEALQSALDPQLLAFRDRVYRRHINTPLDF
jgi:glutathione S-transferase